MFWHPCKYHVRRRFDQLTNDRINEKNRSTWGAKT